MKAAFPEIERIKYEGPQSKNHLSFRHYNPDEKVGNDDTYVVESTPGTVEAGGYSRVRAWVRKTDFVALRTKFFDASGKVQKTLYVRRIKDLEGKPVVVEARMQSENGHATELVVDGIERKDNLPDSLFTPTALER